jgi:hypothetical protein
MAKNCVAIAIAEPPRKLMEVSMDQRRSYLLRAAAGTVLLCLAATYARADAIDGDWCNADPRSSPQAGLRRAATIPATALSMSFLRVKRVRAKPCRSSCFRSIWPMPAKAQPMHRSRYGIAVRLGWPARSRRGAARAHSTPSRGLLVIAVGSLSIPGRRPDR